MAFPEGYTPLPLELRMYACELQVDETRFWAGSGGEDHYTYTLVVFLRGEPFGRRWFARFKVRHRTLEVAQWPEEELLLRMRDTEIVLAKQINDCFTE